MGDIEDLQLCSYFEGHDKAGAEALLPPGVYTLADLRVFGRKRTWCPYFLARHMISFANVVVYNYQYMLDPKVSQMVRTDYNVQILKIKMYLLDVFGLIILFSNKLKINQFRGDLQCFCFD